MLASLTVSHLDLKIYILKSGSFAVFTAQYALTNGYQEKPA
jgi:hypothetical protein